MCEYFIPSDSFSCQPSDRLQSAVQGPGAWSCVITAWDWDRAGSEAGLWNTAMQLSHFSESQVSYSWKKKTTQQKNPDRRSNKFPTDREGKMIGHLLVSLLENFKGTGGVKDAKHWGGKWITVMKIIQDNVVIGLWDIIKGWNGISLCWNICHGCVSINVTLYKKIYSPHCFSYFIMLHPWTLVWFMDLWLMVLMWKKRDIWFSEFLDK